MMVMVPLNWRVIFRVRDNDATESTCQIKFPASVAAAAVIAAAAGFSPIIQGMISGRVIAYSIEREWRETDPAPALPASNVDRVGAFLFQTENDPIDRYVLSLPSIRTELIANEDCYAGVALNLEDPAIVALRNALINGIGGVRACAPWEAWQLGGGWGGGGGGSGGGWGGGGGSGGPWGGGGGSGGDWGGGSGGGWNPEPFDNRYQLIDSFSGSPALLVDLIAAYLGREK